jgi:hypothetical protein
MSSEGRITSDIEHPELSCGRWTWCKYHYENNDYIQREKISENTKKF